MAGLQLINGVAYAWASISVVIFGVPLEGILSIDYEEEQKKENLFGRGRQAIRRGYGNLDTKGGSMEVYMDDLEDLRDALQTTRKIVDIGMFDITVVFERADGSYTRHILRSCEFVNDPFASKQGDSSIKAKLNLIIGSIEK